MFVALDRDGTLIEHVPYLADVKGVKLFDDAATGVKLLNSLQIPVVVLTNQPVIGRRQATMETVNHINEFIKLEMRKQGAHIETFFVCPHHTDTECDCRKPKLGLLTKAADYLNIDAKKCVIIGDSDRDMELARRAGVPGLHVQTGPEGMSSPDFPSFENLLTAIKFAVKTFKMIDLACE
jgi:D-glycero-D-manno-heptose 1,7-bisphosphate phosphatase